MLPNTTRDLKDMARAKAEARRIDGIVESLGTEASLVHEDPKVRYLAELRLAQQRATTSGRVHRCFGSNAQ